MTRIKICGITTARDAEWAAECGADALGFVFAESPRRIEPPEAREIARALDPFVARVGVFVDLPAAEVRAALDTSGCTVAQLHGAESPECVRSLSPYGVIKAFRVADSINEERVRAYADASALLLDTYVAGVAGGTGRRFDHALATALVQKGWRVIVAGGLTPENVAQVISSVRPYGVDVGSGVEAAPGRKDRQKVRDFIAAVRAADRGRAE